MADETRDVRLAKFWEGVLARARAGEITWFTDMTGGAPFAALVPAGRVLPESAGDAQRQDILRRFAPPQPSVAQDPRRPAAPDIVTRLAALFWTLAAETDTRYLTSAGVPDWSGDVPLEAHIERWLRHG